jgi:nicotinate-nucleotide pyrophosphorylase (carboxylating)
MQACDFWDRDIEKQCGNIIEMAVREDVGSGDITTNTLVKAGQRINAHVVAKQHGIIAGLPLLPIVFSFTGQDVDTDFMVRDGSRVKPGDKLCKISGNARAVLTGERTALNFMQRLSGIATLARKFSDRIAGFPCKILDTRKTTPGLRIIEKYAVKVGGAQNHRLGLYDMVLVKENHVSHFGGITSIIKTLKEKIPDSMKIELEVRSLEELGEALKNPPDFIMLDNMSCCDMRKAVEMTAGICKLEASGGVTLENVREIAGTGVDFISAGALTHSAKAFDLSLLVDKLINT